MHIVHIITGLQRGGAEKVLVTLCTEFAQKSYTQTVIFFNDGPLRQELETLEITCLRVQRFNMIALLRLLASLRPCIIHSSLWSANLLARVCGFVLRIPVFCALHTVAEHSGTTRNVIDKLFSWIPAQYIAVSPTVKESYVHFLPAQKITIIENGISLARTHFTRAYGFKAARTHSTSLRASGPIPARGEWSVSGIESIRAGKYTIGSVGRFVPVKNYDILLHAFALLHKDYPETRLMLIGHGPLEGNLRTLAHQLNIAHAVTFIINQPAQDYYAHFDCFVQPSQHEGLSMALLEAIQAGKPVIVTGHAQKHTLIEHQKTGTIIEPGNIKSLYYTLKGYKLNPHIAQNYAQAGYAHVQQNFSAHTMAQRYAELFFS